MQLDYYRSPCQGAAWDSPGVSGPNVTVPPTGDGKPRRHRRWLPVLIVFLSLILLSAAALLVLRILSPDSWTLSREQFDDSDFYFQIPGDSYEDYHIQESQSETATTIPRADPAPGMQLLLSAPPEQDLSFQEIYEKVIPSIVSVRSYSDTAVYIGTGVIMTADGYIITNQHLLSGCSDAQVVLSDGSSYKAKLVGSDAPSDLAVLKIEAQGLPAAEFGDSDLLRVGDTALAIGNPLSPNLFGTMTDGIISAINREVYVNGYNMTLIQTTAALNHGNSGGALLNSAGQVVGITNMKMMSSYDTIEGLGFAIPTSCAKEVVDTLLAEGAITGRPTIGIICTTVFLGDTPLSGQESGVYVDSVTAGGPADRAGVQPGDVIIEANGRTISSLDDLTVVRDEAGVGGALELTVLREDKTVELTLTLVDQYELN